MGVAHLCFAKAAGLVVASVLYTELCLFLHSQIVNVVSGGVVATNRGEDGGRPSLIRMINGSNNKKRPSSEERRQNDEKEISRLTSDVRSGNQTERGRCQKALDDLDELFDLQRSRRQELVLDRVARNALPSRIKFFDLYEPEAVCILEERFGGPSGTRYAQEGDGPKFVCGADLVASAREGETCLVYSVGSDNKISFEISSKEIMGCEVHTFDPTLYTPFVGKDYAEFHPWGFGREGGLMSVEGSEFRTISLVGAMKRLKHYGKTLDIFKIDCEGCEYDAVTDAFDAITSGELRINQIQVEIHSPLHDPHDLVKLFNAADKANMRVFHKERNGWGCAGYTCVEYAFVSQSFLRRVNAMAMGCLDHAH